MLYIEIKRAKSVMASKETSRDRPLSQRTGLGATAGLPSSVSALSTAGQASSGTRIKKATPQGQRTAWPGTRGDS